MRLSDNLLYRRLHSLAGALPLGAFLVFHLYANSFSLSGPGPYDAHVRSLRGLPYLHFLEWTLIFIPLLYHSLYGLYIWYTGQNNFPQYNYARNGMYLLQRITGVIALVFVVYHIADQRLLPAPSYLTVKNSITNPAVFIIYFIGTASVAWHFFHGLWNVSVKWGVAIGPRSQRTVLAVCSALGICLAVVGLRALTGFLG